ncbi:hypothetical protein B0H14DRAFT_2580541 [Mycena olivaceomarginata]|nr:hypothetical protein B0H14DRAFT_2580541 [Mycena olivaceomarginata]
MAPEVGAGSKHTPADQEFLYSLSARLLMEFRSYVFSPTYIAVNAANFLDLEWVDMGALHEFLEQQAQKSIPEVSTTRQTISDSVRVKIEATPFMAPVPDCLPRQPSRARGAVVTACDQIVVELKATQVEGY